jgi:hypothetical protein
MKTEKIYLNKYKEGNIICPQCRKSKQVNAADFKMNHEIKLTCSCRHSYFIKFEQRQYYRKKLSLKGRFEIITHERDVNDKMIVTNLSVAGLRFKTKNVNELHKNDSVKVSFLLNNSMQSQLQIRGVIKYVNGPYVGVEFQELDDESDQLIRQYLSSLAPLTLSKDRDIIEEKRLADEALCVEAAQKELQEYLSSVDVSNGPNFSGKTWDEALSRFRSFWDNRYICTHCHNITHAATAFARQYKCKGCTPGYLSNSPNEIWNIILKHSPQREKYFTEYDAFSVVDMTAEDYRLRYPDGFLVPITKHIDDNSVLANVKNVSEKMRYLGTEIDKSNIDFEFIGQDIKKIRKRNYQINPEKINIGRDNNSDIVFPNANISRTHAYLYVDPSDEKCYLIDGESSNGTFLNNKKITTNQVHELSDGDEIRFGPEKVVYFSPEGFHKLLCKIMAKDAGNQSENEI